MEADPRLKAEVWVQACLRLCGGEGVPAFVARRGDSDAGAVLVKLNRFDLGCTVLVQARTADGRRAWLRGTGREPVAEPMADAYVERQVRYDPDLWVIEIEDRQGRIPFGDPLIED